MSIPVKILVARKSAVMQFMQRYKKEKRYSGWDDDPLFWPEPADYLEFGAIRELVEMPGDEDISPAMFSELKPRLPDLIKDWKSEISKRFTAHVRSCIRKNHRRCRGNTCDHQELLNQDDDQVSDFLERATTVFRCIHCTAKDREFEEWTNMMSVIGSVMQCCSHKEPEDTETKILFDKSSVINHQCLTRERINMEVGILAGMMGADNTLDGYYIKRHKLSFSGIVLDDDYGRVMTKIVTVAHHDPNSATRRDLVHRHFYCHTCLARTLEKTPEKLKNIPCYQSHEMALHIMEHHPDKNAEPRQISRRFYKKLRDFGLGKSIRLGYAQPLDVKVFRCIHCRDLSKEVPPNTRDEITSHVKIAHEIEHPVCNTDFIRLEDADSHYYPPFGHNLFAKKFLVVSARKALGDSPGIDWERLLEEQFEDEEEEREEEEEEEIDYGYEPEPEDYENWESDTDNE
ncbi:hypothetical protein NP233_g5116 [Leucocoprinus birnbaumii]|uniref:Uncharacterized protein n=1 Tax=Leucocoprinus birnbaumii TaxID=56174 RepID=A0AAD5YS68_9AGAR|nr:hypothetical protein NP233_g5116 [Leucocoprinus birnbaumii]